jgi:hypothetical protein
MSHSPDRNCRFNRKNSRTIRLILFLLTARPSFFVTVTPNRDRPCRLGEKTAIKCSFCILRPLLDSAINSCRFKIRSAFVKENCNGQASSFNLKNYEYRNNGVLMITSQWIAACQADSRIRPLALLRLMILLPCLVDIRLRKP